MSPKAKKQAHAITPAMHYTVVIALIVSLVTTFLLGMLLTETLWGSSLNYFSDIAEQGKVYRTQNVSAAQRLSSLPMLPGFPIIHPDPYRPFGVKPIVVDLDNDGYKEMIQASSVNIYIIHHDGTHDLITWNDIENWSTISSVAAADVNGDGLTEIVAIDGNENTYVWSNEGKLLSHWSIVENYSDYNYGSTPVLADIDEDKDLEILYKNGDRTYADHKIWAFHHDGTPVKGWENGIDVYGTNQTKVAAGDIDNDGIDEIVYFEYLDGTASYLPNVKSKIVIRNGNGTLLNTIVVPPDDRGNEARFAGQSPALADLDLDGSLEILALDRTSRLLYVYKSTGELMKGWPQEYSGSGFGYTGLTVANLDKDAELEIVFANSQVSAYNFDGTLVPGFPWQLMSYATGNPSTGQIPRFTIAEILVANVDRNTAVDDPELIIVVGTGDPSSGALHAFNLDGSLVSGWPVSDYAFDAGAVADIDNDRINDIIAVYRNRSNLEYKFQVFRSGGKVEQLLDQWTMTHHDARHTSNFESGLPQNILIKR